MLESKTESPTKTEETTTEKNTTQTEPVKAPRKALKPPSKAKPFVPEEELKTTISPKPAEESKPAQPYSLMDELKPSAVPNPSTRNAVSGSSASYIPFMPFPQPMMGFPMQVPLMPTPVQMPYVLPSVPQQTPQPAGNSSQEDYAMMYQSLINSGMLNVNPKVYNQLVPGQELQMNLQMHPGLQEYAEELNNMNQEDLVDYYQEMLMQEYVTQPEHSFGDHSHNGTYSDLNDADFDDFEEEPTHNENPQEWETDPETAKRHAEIRKNFFNPEFKDCDCCKGYISNCGNEICKNLGVCHCVVRKQNEDNNEPTDGELITECQNCTCCQGYIYKCDCVTAEGKSSCKCTT